MPFFFTFGMKSQQMNENPAVWQPRVEKHCVLRKIEMHGFPSFSYFFKHYGKTSEHQVNSKVNSKNRAECDFYTGNGFLP